MLKKKANRLTLASTTVTSMPNDFSCRAAARPAIPAPITITFPFLIPTNQYTMIKLYKKNT